METNGDQKKTEEGNTIPLPDTNKHPKRPNQLKNWCFTYNNYKMEDLEMLETKFKEICKNYCFQQEKGENGTPHLQGAITLKKASRWSEFGLPDGIHWEPMHCMPKAFEYCHKEETRDGKVFTNMTFEQPPEPLQSISLWEWQKKAVALFENSADDRTINWIWDEKGGIGKSVLAKWLFDNKNVVFISGGRTQDIMSAIFQHKVIDSKTIVVFNIPRAHRNKIGYDCMEMIKDGLIFNSKYEVGQRRFNAPHILVFANFPPDRENTLSLDRFKEYTVINNDLIKIEEKKVNVKPPIVDAI